MFLFSTKNVEHKSQEDLVCGKKRASFVPYRNIHLFLGVADLETPFMKSWDHPPGENVAG